MTTSSTALTWIAFAGKRRIALGTPQDVAARAFDHIKAHPKSALLIFDATSGQVLDIDLRGSLEAVLHRLPRPAQATPAPGGPTEAANTDAPRGPGRPKLGVTAREVTLLPRHWDWLASQSGGASVALRKLVEQALRAGKEADRIRAAIEASYRFMHAMAGDEAGFEEASRALFAQDQEALQRQVATWPRDVRAQTLAMAALMAPAFPTAPTATAVAAAHDTPAA